MIQKLSNQRGLTLFEAILVLLIGGLILSGLWVAYGRVTLNQRSSQMMSILVRTLSVTRDYIATNNWSSSAVLGTLGRRLWDERLMPSELKVTSVTGSTAVFDPPMGSSFRVDGIRLPDNDQPSEKMLILINLTFDGPYWSQQCKAFVPQLLTNATKMKDLGLVGYDFAGLGTGPYHGQPVPAPMTITQAADACNISTYIQMYFTARD